MELPAGLLEKFISGQCSEAERHRVQLYLTENPAALDAFFTESAWRAFPDSELPVETSQKIFQVIDRHINRKQSLRSTLVRRWSAAAAVLILTGVAAWWWPAAHLPASAPVRAVVSKPATEPAPAPALAFKINTSGKTLRVVLPDGGRAELSPGSQISYARGFEATSRSVYLKGTALFTVATDRVRPFTVYAGRVGTTALGTIFRVSEQPRGITDIDLLQGKVVVRPDSSLAQMGIRETYLKPGQRLSIDQESHTAIVNAYQPATKAVRLKAVLTFDNQPLTEILRAIETACHTRYSVAAGALDNLTFTGVFNENKETPEDFLATICLLNNLSMEKQNDSIRIVPNQ